MMKQSGRTISFLVPILTLNVLVNPPNTSQLLWQFCFEEGSQILYDTITISQSHYHFSRLLSWHWDRPMSQLLTSSVSWDVGSPPSFKRSDRSLIYSTGCQSLC